MSESEGTGEECDEVTRRVRASERSDQPTLSFAMRGGSGGTGGAQRRREHPPVSQRAFPRRFTFRLFRLLSLSFRFHTFHHHLPPFPFTPHHTANMTHCDVQNCVLGRSILILRACVCVPVPPVPGRCHACPHMRRTYAHAREGHFSALACLCVAVWRALGHMSCARPCASCAWRSGAH